MRDWPSPDRGSDGASARVSDSELLDLIAQVRDRLGGLRRGDASPYESALAALEAEAASRGLPQAGARERRPVAVARGRLADRLGTADAAELLTLVPDLDPPGLYDIFRVALERLSAADAVRVLEALFTRLDELHFEPAAAHRRRRRYLTGNLPLERRLERLRKAVAFQFRTLHHLG